MAARDDSLDLELGCGTIEIGTREEVLAHEGMPWSRRVWKRDAGEDLMTDVLVRIKRAVLTGHFAFSEKAFMEMDADRITKQDVVESIVNAVRSTRRCGHEVRF